MKVRFLGFGRSGGGASRHEAWGGGGLYGDKSCCWSCCELPLTWLHHHLFRPGLPSHLTAWPTPLPTKRLTEKQTSPPTGHATCSTPHSPHRPPPPERRRAAHPPITGSPLSALPMQIYQFPKIPAPCPCLPHANCIITVKSKTPISKLNACHLCRRPKSYDMEDIMGVTGMFVLSRRLLLEGTLGIF